MIAEQGKLSYHSHLAMFDRPAATTRPRWSEPPAGIIDQCHVPSGERAEPAVEHDSPQNGHGHQDGPCCRPRQRGNRPRLGEGDPLWQCGVRVGK